MRPSQNVALQRDVQGKLDTRKSSLLWVLLRILRRQWLSQFAGVVVFGPVRRVNLTSNRHREAQSLKEQTVSIRPRITLHINDELAKPESAPKVIDRDSSPSSRRWLVWATSGRWSAQDYFWRFLFQS